MKTIFHSGLVLSGNNKLGSLRQRNCVWRDRPRELLGSAFHFSQPMRLSGGGVNLRCRRFRHLAGLPVFLQRLTFRLQPIVHTLSMSAAAFDVDLVCAQLDFFTCGMALGSLWFAPRRGFFYRLVHYSSLGTGVFRRRLNRQSLLQATLTPRRRDLLGDATSKVVAAAAAACSRIFTALPTSATPKIRKVALVLGSVPQ